jgi:hypothetical protein
MEHIELPAEVLELFEALLFQVFRACTYFSRKGERVRGGNLTREYACAIDMGDST